MQGISKRFGATQRSVDVSLEVAAGEVLALIGENGAGKSTLMKVLSGAHRPDAGKMTLAGRPYAPSGPHEARVGRRRHDLPGAEPRAGPERRRQHHAGPGAASLRLAGAIGASGAMVGQALDMLGHPDLRPEMLVGRLSVGAQQLVEIARALAADASVIVFDEPTSSLSRHDVERLFDVIRRLKQSGIAIVYISHFLEEIRQVADRYTVLRDGRTVGSGALAGTSEAQIVSLMVGRSVSELFPSVPHQPGEVILSLASRSAAAGSLATSAWSCAAARSWASPGLVGAGRTELLRAIFGLDPVTSGRVRVAGYSPRHTPAARIRAGLGLVSEDRKGEGLAQDRSIADNLTSAGSRPTAASAG